MREGHRPRGPAVFGSQGRGLAEFHSMQEVARVARRNLNSNVWDYLMGGSESETTLRRNRMALDALALRPRILRDVRNVDTSATLFGEKVRLPVMLAPIGSLQLIESGGAVTVAKAAEEFGVISFMSSVTQPGIEAVGAATGHPKVFQLYVRGDDAWIDEQVVRARDNGFFMFCFTVDVALYSRRERDLIKGWVPSARAGVSGTGFQAALSWDNIRHFKHKHDMPLMLKGIATAEDAVIAVEHGVDVVYVSNHGGRQLDHGRGTVEVLPEVVEAVAGKARIVVDGGFTRGTDVVKAIALGADAVGIGKLQGLGLAAGGQAGLVRMLELLEFEMRHAMGLLGITSLDMIDRKMIVPAMPVVPPHATSQFHLFQSGETGIRP